MPSSAEEELTLIMTCLKHTETRGKPDFEAAAEELGIKPSTCYHRHWGLLKKWGMTGSRAADAGKALNNTNGGASVPKTPTTPAKRGRKPAGASAKKASNRSTANLDEDAEDDLEASPLPDAKRAKLVRADEVRPATGEHQDDDSVEDSDKGLTST